MKYFLVILWTSLLGLSLHAQHTLSLYDLRVEYKKNPIGLDVEPRFSWKLRSESNDLIQTYYTVKVATSPSDLRKYKNLIWNSGRVFSDQSVHRIYAGPDLQSGQRYFWQVEVWDNKGNHAISDVAYWEMGLLQELDWKANWISAAWEEKKDQSEPAHQYRKVLKVASNVQSARLYISSCGLYEAYLNGQKVGDEVFTPGWTSYNKRLQYQSYDVTELLQKGDNCLGVMVGDGWYRGYLVWQKRRNTYGDQLKLIAQLELVYKNGERETILTDQSWKAHKSPILATDIYHGESYDARQETAGWTQTDFNDKDWGAVQLIEHPKGMLCAPIGPPVKRIDEIKPIALIQSPSGEQILDMGQNMVGRMRFTVSGPAGTKVVLKHAEVLDQDGNFYTENLRHAKQLVQYTLKGDGAETYEPYFTFQGFRYVKVEGWPSDIDLDDFRGIVIHSDMPASGYFHCSDSLLNQLQHNIQWGQKGNFLDVPTDCPQRDERMGWTGDAQVFAPTAAFNMEVAGFFGKWLRDLAADQLEDGRVPFVIPQVMRDRHSAATGWADASTIIPWEMYKLYGDFRILQVQYPSMQAWHSFMRQEAGEDHLWNTGFHFGDWLFYSPPDDRDGKAAITEKALIQQSFYAYSTWILYQSALLLGKDSEAEDYEQLLANIKKAYLQEYVSPNGRLTSGTQTAYVLALNYDLLPDEMRDAAAARLVENVRSYGHITTGFLGTPHICHVLTRFGYLDDAYKLLHREEYPSWLYPVRQGATTIWERWDGIRPDGSFQNAGMNSFNHYAYGAIGDWMYRIVAGLNVDVEQPGYKHIILRPQPGGKLTQAKVEYESLYGPIMIGWELKKHILHLEVEIPPNTQASLYFPWLEDDQHEVLQRQLGNAKLQNTHMGWMISLGSGQYRYQYPVKLPEKP